MNTYYEFATEDYEFLTSVYKKGMSWNSICSISQQIAERFLKHLIETYCLSHSEDKAQVLKSHNLRKLKT